MIIQILYIIKVYSFKQKNQNNMTSRIFNTQVYIMRQKIYVSKFTLKNTRVIIVIN